MKKNMKAGLEEVARLSAECLSGRLYDELNVQEKVLAAELTACGFLTKGSSDQVGTAVGYLPDKLVFAPGEKLKDSSELMPRLFLQEGIGAPALCVSGHKANKSGPTLAQRNAICEEIARRWNSHVKYARAVALLCDYGKAKFGDEWWPGAATDYLGPAMADELVGLLGEI